MTEKQFNHYIKGGMFNATYNPKVTSDIDASSKLKIGKKIVVYQNTQIAPLQEYPQYRGQHAFSSREIFGWFPEEDIEDLEIIDEFIEFPEPLPVYMYALTFLKQEKIEPNYGKGTGIEVPYTSYREYSTKQDSHVLHLTNPVADKIEKYVWQGKYGEKIKWKTIYHE